MITFIPLVLGLMGKYRLAFVISIINSVGYLYLSIVMISLGGENLFVYKVVLVCLTITNMILIINFNIEINRDYERITV